MVSKALQSAAEELGFSYVEKSNSDKTHMYGIYGGYLTTLYDAGNNKTVYINYYMHTSEDEDESVRLLELSESLKNTAGDLNLTDYSVEKDGLFCTVNCHIDQFMELLDKLIELLGSEGLAGVSNCSCCGNKIGKRYPKKVLMDKHNLLLCEFCALEKIESHAEEAKQSQTDYPSRLGLGILGAVLGGAIGILLYFLIYNFLSPLFADSSFEIRYIFSLLGFAAAYLVFCGYRFFSKRPCIGAYVSVSAVSLISVALGQYIGSFVGYAKLQGFTLAQAAKIPSMWLIHLRSTVDKSLTYEQSVLEMYDVSSLFYKLLCFSLLFALIGTIIFLLGFHEKSKTRIVPLEVETLRISKQDDEDAR